MFLSNFSKEWQLKNIRIKEVKKLSTPKTIYRIQSPLNILKQFKTTLILSTNTLIKHQLNLSTKEKESIG